MLTCFGVAETWTGIGSLLISCAETVWLCYPSWPGRAPGNKSKRPEVKLTKQDTQVLRVKLRRHDCDMSAQTNHLLQRKKGCKRYMERTDLSGSASDLSFFPLLLSFLFHHISLFLVFMLVYQATFGCCSSLLMLCVFGTFHDHFQDFFPLTHWIIWHLVLALLIFGIVKYAHLLSCWELDKKMDSWIGSCSQQVVSLA